MGEKGLDPSAKLVVVAASLNEESASVRRAELDCLEKQLFKAGVILAIL